MNDDRIIRATFPAVDYDEDTDTYHETGDTIEVELTAEQVARGPVSYFVDDEKAPLISNEDGTFTRLDTTAPQPKEKRND